MNGMVFDRYLRWKAVRTFNESDRQRCQTLWDAVGIQYRARVPLVAWWSVRHASERAGIFLIKKPPIAIGEDDCCQRCILGDKMRWKPDPNADFNSDGHSNDECHEDHQPLEPRLDDAKRGNLLTSWLVVVVVGLRERSPVECLWGFVRYNLESYSVWYLPRTTFYSPEAPMHQTQRLSHHNPVLELWQSYRVWRASGSNCFGSCLSLDNIQLGKKSGQEERWWEEKAAVFSIIQPWSPLHVTGRGLSGRKSKSSNILNTRTM